MALRYLLFDLDGTLIDTTNLILNCYRASVSGLVENPPSDEEILKGFGRPLPDQLWRLFPTLRDQIDEMQVLWRTAQDSLHDQLIQPFPHTAEVLSELRRRGYSLGIVTSKERVTAFRGMALYGLDGMMNTVVSLEDTSNHKPHPEPVLRGVEKLAGRVEETIYIGDSLHDMRAGREAGVKVAAAMWGPFAKAPLLEFGPDYVLNSIRDLLQLCPPLGSYQPSAASYQSSGGNGLSGGPD